MERAFSPFCFYRFYSWGFTPGWYGVAPLALPLPYSHGFIGAEGAIHISLGITPMIDPSSRPCKAHG
jgi:hypothetical protein